MKIFTRTFALSVVAILTVAATATAQYDPPSNPGVPTPRPGGAATLKVCKKGCKYKTIQAGVKAAQSGDIVKIADGTYKGQVTIEGHSKDAISLIGNAANPRKVLIDAKEQLNGVKINGADDVSLKGLSTHGYGANGFFAVNVDGYKFDRLVATGFGVYGIYARHAKGGSMTNSEAYYNTDAGFYIGETPHQDKPKWTSVKNVVSWGNVLGWSGTNMRYVSISNSKFLNNGTGIIPNSLTSEQYPPEEDNVITNNDIMWNNFNYFKASPFDAPPKSAAGINYPIGVGVLLFGGRRQTVSNNRVFGNWVAGVGLINQVSMAIDSSKGDCKLDVDNPLFQNCGITKSEPVGLTGNWKLDKPWQLADNVVKDNVMGNAGKDLNGRDLYYDGSGQGNCFKGNRLSNGVANLPVFSEAAFPTCVAAPGRAVDTRNPAAGNEGVGWATGVKKSKGMIVQPVTSLGNLKPFPTCKVKKPCGSLWNKKIKPPH